ncbi:MAG: FAD-dependent oxidoreductase [Acutalibacteraceae bacterium]|nr:FAD-dependent oxidoreductase [Acutalibacteraceae bacterium]
MPQYRKIRRIIGEYTFVGTDGEQFEDSIGCIGDFRYPGRHYQLPFRTLYNKKYPNLLAAGRIISASGDGWEITRVIPVCALTGQAAGIAASMLAAGNGSFDSMVGSLQNYLADGGVNIRF